MCVWLGLKNAKMKNYLVWEKKKNEMIENNVCLNLLSYLYYIFKKIYFLLGKKKLNLMLKKKN